MRKLTFYLPSSRCVHSSILFLVFFQVASASPITSIASHGTWIILTWVMWTIGVAVYTAALGGGLDCGNPDTFLHCPQLNALEAFSWIIWFAASPFCNLLPLEAVS
jgi:hypothetical protein